MESRVNFRENPTRFDGRHRMIRSPHLNRVYAVYPQMSQIYADIEGRSIRMAAEIWDTIW